MTKSLFPLTLVVLGVLSIAALTPGQAQAQLPTTGSGVNVQNFPVYYPGYYPTFVSWPYPAAIYWNPYSYNPYPVSPLYTSYFPPAPVYPAQRAGNNYWARTTYAQYYYSTYRPGNYYD